MLCRTYDARLFFFFFESRESPETAPVVLWMSGGPGCSSEIAVFAENGPWTINADHSLNETRFGYVSQLDRCLYYKIVRADQKAARLTAGGTGSTT